MITACPTNTEFLVELMEFSRHGALMQLFVMTALEKYAEMVKENPLSEGGLISSTAWTGCADEVLEKLEERFR